MLRMIVVQLGNAFRNKYKIALTKTKTESSLSTKGTFLVGQVWELSYSLIPVVLDNTGPVTQNAAISAHAQYNV